MFRRLSLHIQLVAVILAGLCGLIPQHAAAQGWTPRQIQTSISGDGSTFPAPLIYGWLQAYKRTVPNVSIRYTVSNSVQGQDNFRGRIVDFGVTDSFLGVDSFTGNASDTLYVPIIVGAVVPTYNLQGVNNLRFSAEALVGIYMGTITKWNDRVIQSDNPGVNLPDLSIVPFYQNGGSGATAIFTDYLSKVDRDWAESIGRGESVRWPDRAIGQNGDPGVASAVKYTEGSIGYISLDYARANRLPIPAVRNAEGMYVAANADSIGAAAAASPALPSNLAGSITNAPGNNSYPIAGYTYVLIRQTSYDDITKAQALSDVLYWSLTEGQGATRRLSYAPLPDSVRQDAIRQLRSMRVGDQVVFDGPVT